MSILAVLQEVKECVLVFSNYVFELDENKFKDSEECFDFVRILLLEGPENKKFSDNNKRKETSFRNYLLLRHPEFQKELDGDSKSKSFFGASWSFLETVVTELSRWLPLSESGVMIADAFWLKDKSSLLKLQKAASHFTNIFDPHSLTRFNHELEKLSVNFGMMQSLFYSPQDKIG